MANPPNRHVQLEPALDGPTNMARDVALLEALSFDRPIVARVYGWEGPWVSLGCFQDPVKDLLPQCPVPWVMRPTGGKGVLHGHDVTVGMAASLRLVALLSGETPAEEERLLRSVKAVYRAVCRPLVAALNACGIPAALGEDMAAGASARGPRTSDCFAHVSPNDIADARTGRKVCGCALKIMPEGVLVQASIPAGPPLVDPSQVYPEPAEAGWSRLRPDDFATALDEALARLTSGPTASGAFWP